MVVAGFPFRSLDVVTDLSLVALLDDDVCGNIVRVGAGVAGDEDLVRSCNYLRGSGRSGSKIFGVADVGRRELMNSDLENTAKAARRLSLAVDEREAA